MNNAKKARIRQGKIRDMLQKKDVIKLHEFCSELNASIATIRNDLTYLESQGLLKRVFGGAISTEGTPRNTGYHARITMLKQEKMEIAQYVCDRFIREGSVVCLDAGSSNHYIAQMILERDIACCVVTNSFNAATILAKAKKVQLHCAGGVLNREQNAFYDDVAYRSLKGIQSDVYFVSPNGISLDKQITSSAKQENKMKKMFAQQAKKIIVVADHSKFDKVANEALLTFEEVDEIVCDAKTAIEVVEKYQKQTKVTRV